VIRSAMAYWTCTQGERGLGISSH